MAVADRMLKLGVRNLRHWAVNLRRWIVGVHCCAVKSCLTVAVKPLKIRLLAQLTGIKKQPVSYAYWLVVRLLCATAR